MYTFENNVPFEKLLVCWIEIKKGASSQTFYNLKEA